MIVLNKNDKNDKNYLIYIVNNKKLNVYFK